MGGWACLRIPALRAFPTTAHEIFLWGCPWFPTQPGEVARGFGQNGVNLPEKQAKALVRVKGIEPSPQAWEARILPLNYTRPEQWMLLSVKSLLLKAEKARESSIFQGEVSGVNPLNLAKKALALRKPRAKTSSGQRV